MLRPSGLLFVAVCPATIRYSNACLLTEEVNPIAPAPLYHELQIYNS